jgi:hypothetical protein
MRLGFIAALLSLTGSAAMAHPHAGGIVVETDGTVLVGDVLKSRLLVIENTGAWHTVHGAGHVRDLELAADGVVYGVSQGSGLWSIGSDETVHPILPEFHGLFTRRSDGTLALAPADALDNRRPCSSKGRMENESRWQRSGKLMRSPQVKIRSLWPMVRHCVLLTTRETSQP